MRDFPVFTTENGVGSLILREIPYHQTAYIRIADSQSPVIFLKECVSFCKMVGAEYIYATGHESLQVYPLHTVIQQMRILKAQLPETDAALFPVTEQTLDQWRQIYNNKMQAVPNAAYMTESDGKAMLSRGDGYFVHRSDRLLGIGKASGECLEAVASVLPGAGRDCVLALAHAIGAEQILLEVASTNLPAIRLYEGLGFVKTKVISQWHKII